MPSPIKEDTRHPVIRLHRVCKKSMVAPGFFLPETPQNPHCIRQRTESKNVVRYGLEYVPIMRIQKPNLADARRMKNRVAWKITAK